VGLERICVERDVDNRGVPLSSEAVALRSGVAGVDIVTDDVQVRIKQFGIRKCGVQSNIAAEAYT
jgi:hypothetical protein